MKKKVFSKNTLYKKYMCHIFCQRTKKKQNLHLTKFCTLFIMTETYKIDKVLQASAGPTAQELKLNSLTYKVYPSPNRLNVSFKVINIGSRLKFYNTTIDAYCEA